jgi:Cu-Zn family superoxide dismutase
MRSSSTFLLFALTMALSACNRPADTAAVDDAATPPVPTPAPVPPPAEPEAPAAAATAALTATKDNTVTGELRFEAMDGGVRITGQVSGLKPDTEHGFHVHEKGDCSAPDAKSAGDHFNPASSAHGRVSAPVHHAGDTDNIVADATGVANVDTRLQGATVGDGAPTDVVGKGVIVHADPDDYTTQPTGNAGARLACGVIAAAR